MNMINRKIFSGYVIFLAFLAGCASPESTLQSPPQKFKYGIISLTDNIPYQLLSSRDIKYGFLFNPVGSTTKTTFSLGPFLNVYGYLDSAGYQNAGAVTFNGTTLSKNTENTYYSFSATPKFDGSYQVWNVPGGSNIGAFKDSIQAMSDTVCISSPANASDVSKSSPLSISWTASSNTGVTDYLTMWSDSTGQGWSSTVADNSGLYTVSPTMMSGIHTGITNISLSRGVYLEGTASDGKKYIMVHWYTYSLQVNLTS